MAVKRKEKPEAPKFARCECGVTSLVCRLRNRPGEKNAPCCAKCNHERNAE